MARKGVGNLQVGGELVRSGFSGVSDEFRNILLLLETAGLSFVLEKECRVLDKEVLEFFKHTKLKHGGSLIKSSVRNFVVRMTPSFLNKFLRLLQVEEEDALDDGDYRRALSFCDLGRKTTSIRRKEMNDEGKLLTDIIGKVLLCKIGSHDYVSRDMFRLLTAIICRKKVNWGIVLFERIKASVQAPNFGRIISLYLNQLDVSQFDMSSGMPIHHLKKIDSTIFSRWERRIPRHGVRRDVKIDIDEQRGNSLNPNVAPEIHSTAVKEERLSEDVAEIPIVQTGFQSQVPDVHITAEPDVQTVEELNVQTDVRVVLGSTSAGASGLVEDLSEKELPAEVKWPLLEGSLQEDLSAVRASEKGKAVLESSAQEPLVPYFLLKDHSSPGAAASSSFERNFDTNFENFEENRSQGVSAPPSDSSLLKSIEAMLAKQKVHFDFSLKQVFKRVGKVEKDLNNGLAQVNRNMDKLQTFLTEWMTQGGKAIDHSIQGTGHVYSQVQHLSTKNDALMQSHDSSMHYIDTQMEKYKSDIIQTLVEEVRKGEKKIHSKMDSLNNDMRLQVHRVNEYCFQNIKWLHEVLAGGAPTQPFEGAPAQPFEGAPAQPFEGSEPAGHHFEEQHFDGSEHAPPMQYAQVLSDSGDVEILEEESSRPPLKRRRYEEGPSASRSDPSQRREFAEVWSPISKGIILDTYKLFDLTNKEPRNYYNKEKWDKHEVSNVKKRIHFRKFGTDPTAPTPPPKYYPKPNDHFDRQHEKRKGQH